MKNKYILITGASSGLGLEFAKLAARKEYNLILNSRSKSELDKIAASLRAQYRVTIHALEKDLSLLSSPSEIFSEVNDHLKIQVYMLINNAGFGTSGKFAESNYQTEINQVNVNVTSLTALTRLFLPGMIERNSGIIINVASTAAYQPGPYMSVYYATKAYVKNFTLALHNELKDTKVKVCLFSPGPTNTNFQNRANITRSVIGRKQFMLTAEKAVRIGFNNALKGKREIVPGLMNKIGVSTVKLFPEKLITTVVGYLNKNRFV